jgi:xanthine dehydrogenase YagR molybdenum-binding subunit
MIGQPTTRVDGPVKVTGRATYAYEYWQDEPPLYGVVVTATIGRGRITEIDTSPAERSPGVRAVITHKNVPPQGARDDTIPWSYWRARPTLGSEEISHYGEVVALVVATTLEEAQTAANLLHITYAIEPGHFDLSANEEQAYPPKHLIPAMPFLPTDSSVGNLIQNSKTPK